MNAGQRYLECVDKYYEVESIWVGLINEGIASVSYLVAFIWLV